MSWSLVCGSHWPHSTPEEKTEKVTESQNPTDGRRSQFFPDILKGGGERKSAKFVPNEIRN